jgi:N-acetylmuramoyl-L-alanine amidase
LSYAFRLERRPLDCIDLVVLHCTELPDLATAREYGERICYAGSRSGNSGHYYLDRDGTTEEWVPCERVAHHARGYNPRSVGIELVNRGRWPDWCHSERQHMTEQYPAKQIAALHALLERLCRQLPELRWIAGHEQLDVSTVPATDDATAEVKRKRDPGPLFPWDRVLAATTLLPYRP